MSRTKKILLGVLVLLIVIQFIRPARNINGQVLATDITKLYSIPENVQASLKTACYDCHSNNTRYPWYVNIQPVGWYLSWHVSEGKEELNFSDFGSYSQRKQKGKFKSIAKTVEEDEMPLSSYTLIHKDARLTNEEKTQLIEWAKNYYQSVSP
ncbi:cytochrome C [Niastella vici]|uniref:Cytochrome C n=1 Tax=Niastella vici TaxID=1703345 RepID=A0A1V9FS44_9BACT|nr:heme-binding domain-containing protein [Niastella vici]OQP61185.1 cytochrome C [Niastella vici]